MKRKWLERTIHQIQIKYLYLLFSLSTKSDRLERKPILFFGLSTTFEEQSMVVVALLINY